MTALWVVLGGAAGAPARYLLDLAVQARFGTRVPRGTMAVNVLGSLVLGAVASVVAHGSASSWVLTLVGTGLCGAFTTFSTFSFETVRLVEEQRTGSALGYVALSLVLGLIAVVLGWWLGALA